MEGAIRSYGSVHIVNTYIYIYTWIQLAVDIINEQWGAKELWSHCHTPFCGFGLSIFAPLVLFIGRRSGFESGKQQVGHFLMDHQNMNMSETYPNLGTCEDWRPFVWSWSRLSQLVDLQHPQAMGIAGTGEAWSPQRLCWTQLAADDAGAMKCQGLHMARMTTDVWTVSPGFVGTFMEISGEPPKPPWLIIEPPHWLARTWLHRCQVLTTLQVFSEFKGELGGSETASFQRSQLFSATKNRCRGRRNWKMPCSDLPRPWSFLRYIRTEFMLSYQRYQTGDLRISDFLMSMFAGTKSSRCDFSRWIFKVSCRRLEATMIWESTSSTRGWCTKPRRVT